ncbi:MAG: Tat pathway signal sequence [Coriobacteriales bacterium]|nr:Tat pathway signal sequence [Coriobacteriales bacterium]
MAKQTMTWQELIESFGKRDAKWTSGSASTIAPEQMRRFFKRLLIVVLIALIPVILGSYWWFHPAINIHSVDTWSFVTIFVLLPLFAFLRIRSLLAARGTAKHDPSPARAKRLELLSYLPIAVIGIALIGGIASSVIFPGNAERYATVLNTEKRDFSESIHEVNYSEIPVIDRDSAALLGKRVMGAIPEYVSQFEISEIYSQINYQGHPVRVSPLGYADFFKWFNNRAEGIPAYVLIDMTTQDANIVRLEEPILYSQSEPLGRNIDRHVQLSFPFYMFDQKSFEIDEDGKPWWVCPVQTRTIGLFGGTDIKRVVLCDATNGEFQDLAIEDCPSWVDRVFPAELLVEQYNWSGAYSSGWLNSWIGQEGVVQTTPGTDGLQGYNYIAQDDDVWVYTGVTSAVADNSIVGFLLVNQRTKESHFYAIAGATEESAMNSAEGQVQHLGYRATFPLLLNINSQPTYFMALKDNAGLVKQYAMLDIQRYQSVAVGDTVEACQQVYQRLLVENGVEVPDAEIVAGTESTGTVERIASVVIEGNSHFYLVLANDSRIYDCALPGLLDVLAVQEGDVVTLTYQEPEDSPVYPVESIKVKAGDGTAEAGAGAGAGAGATAEGGGSTTPATGATGAGGTEAPAAAGAGAGAGEGADAQTPPK